MRGRCLKNSTGNRFKKPRPTQTPLREDEEFVITSVASAFSASWRPGENPPDAYLVLGSNEIAVEITTLTQYVTDGRGTRSRLSDDLATAALANALNAQLKDLIPDGYTIGMVLSSPILQNQRTRAKLGRFLRGFIADLTLLDADQKIEIYGNKITVFLTHHGETGYKKVSAAFGNRNSNPKILDNVIQILADRIATKALKCIHLRDRGPIWLALFNDYWLTDGDTYRYALSLMSLEHPFQKILLVNGDRTVEPLIDSTQI